MGEGGRQKHPKTGGEIGGRAGRRKEENRVRY